ncbi:hypothetical protein CYLTODRAFT_120335 [Cylindrobasidium torrendii FP15055 ss-10]|uniref:Uncharacterized protein n=1 Tax=Cylindrobasidium torrendii FP15055 ss-10 TaxID=1314674 RepID=A0A0D7AZW0_9AGAR|nr:hypothetical protein CYLTODRAFT_120335 [Cylindrobasidium torrendii FP15055 ss-10]
MRRKPSDVVNGLGKACHVGFRGHFSSFHNSHSYHQDSEGYFAGAFFALHTTFRIIASTLDIPTLGPRPKAQAENTNAGGSILATTTWIQSSRLLNVNIWNGTTVGTWPAYFGSGDDCDAKNGRRDSWESSPEESVVVLRTILNCRCAPFLVPCSPRTDAHESWNWHTGVLTLQSTAGKDVLGCDSIFRAQEGRRGQEDVVLSEAPGEDVMLGLPSIARNTTVQSVSSMALDRRGTHAKCDLQERSLHRKARDVFMACSLLRG